MVEKNTCGTPLIDRMMQSFSDADDRLRGIQFIFLSEQTEYEKVTFVIETKRNTLTCC